MKNEYKYESGSFMLVIDQKFETLTDKIMSVHRSNDCTVTLSTIHPTTLKIEISKSGLSKSAEFDLRTPYEKFAVFVDWAGDAFTFHTLSLDGEASEVEVEALRLELETAIDNAISSRATDLSQKNIDDIRSTDELREQLEQRINSLDKIISLVSSGDNDHYPTVSASIRSLISRGGRNMKPLLQRYAARYGTIVPIYSVFMRGDLAGPNKEKLIATFPRARISPTIGPNTPHLMDIDTWLAMPGLYYDGKNISNNDLIRSYADSEGSHVDEKENDTVRFLKTVSFGSDKDYADEMHSLLLDAATTIVVVGRQMIAGPKPWTGLKAERRPED